MPELPRSLLWMYNAYIELAARRPYDSMGNPNYIPVSEVSVYGREVLGFSGNMLRLFHLVIGHIDTKVLSLHYQKEAERKEAEKSKTA